MPAFPDTGHLAKQDGDTLGQISDRDHRQPLGKSHGAARLFPAAPGRTGCVKGKSDHALGIPAVLCFHILV